ncbi:hypothetical protein BpHYR1_034112 [Brachionus plicatilis]|uniref:Uncharacterized protein n=1 Tax=Brachionus plicatilis TaxID=10195 RepID=A0A3M7T594_BRAPC|nr:hypothetical protein BpHYR1_034112 [Brachionus plicatilis]
MYTARPLQQEIAAGHHTIGLIGIKMICDNLREIALLPIASQAFWSIILERIRNSLNIQTKPQDDPQELIGNGSGRGAGAEHGEPQELIGGRGNGNGSGSGRGSGAGAEHGEPQVLIGSGNGRGAGAEHGEPQELISGRGNGNGSGSGRGSGAGAEHGEPQEEICGKGNGNGNGVGISNDGMIGAAKEAPNDEPHGEHILIFWLNSI